jgi:hypothetical protein
MSIPSPAVLALSDRGQASFHAVVTTSGLRRSPKLVLALLAGGRSTRGSGGHPLTGRYREAEFSGGVKGLRNQGEEFGGELYAA